MNAENLLLIVIMAILSSGRVRWFSHTKKRCNPNSETESETESAIGVCLVIPGILAAVGGIIFTFLFVSE